jgi:hypothetical protein
MTLTLTLTLGWIALAPVTPPAVASTAWASAAWASAVVTPALPRAAAPAGAAASTTCNPSGGPEVPPGALAVAPTLLSEAWMAPNNALRLAQFEAVQRTAEEAIARNPRDLEARWWRVAALGHRIDHESPRQKVLLAGEVNEEARVMLAIDPDHPGAHHALGRLNAGILRLNRVLRFFALRIFGQGELDRASWEIAEDHMRTARDAVPCALLHRFELARMLADQGRTAEARAELDALLALPDRIPHDPILREQARGLRESLR